MIAISIKTPREKCILATRLRIVCLAPVCPATLLDRHRANQQAMWAGRPNKKEHH
jgi:hypothetical protein